MSDDLAERTAKQEYERGYNDCARGLVPSPMWSTAYDRGYEARARESAERMRKERAK